LLDAAELGEDPGEKLGLHAALAFTARALRERAAHQNDAVCLSDVLLLVPRAGLRDEGLVVLRRRSVRHRSARVCLLLRRLRGWNLDLFFRLGRLGLLGERVEVCGRSLRACDESRCEAGERQSDKETEGETLHGRALYPWQRRASS